MTASKVVNTQPFELVYSLVQHPYMGIILEPRVVQINSKEQYTLSHQKVFHHTLEYFQKRLHPGDPEIVKLLDECDPEIIVKKFYNKKKIRPSEFFQRHLDEKLLNDYLRPYLEERIAKAFELLRGRYLFFMGNDNNPTSRKIEIAKSPCSVLFHFRRNEESTRYFPTLKYEGERIDFMYKGAQIICNEPAWMLLENTLHDFSKHVEGKKLQPFLSKRWIEIPRSSEGAWFKKFGIQLIEKFDVYAEGFEIKSAQERAAAVLKLSANLENKLALFLFFNYGGKLFPASMAKPVSVHMEEHQGQLSFTRLRRSIEWEQRQKEKLERMGLRQLGDCSYVADNSYTGQHEIIAWLGKNMPLLEQNGFQVETKDTQGIPFYIGPVEVQFDISEKPDWFDVNATLHIGGHRIPFAMLRRHLMRGEHEFTLPDGKIFVIPNDWFEKYLPYFELSESDEEIRLKKHHLSLISDLDPVGPGTNISSKLEKLRKHDSIQEYELPAGFQGTLRPYQQAGYNWLMFLQENGFGGCLADDMGLGKTIQVLCALQKTHELYQERLRTDRILNKQPLLPSEAGISMQGPIRQLSLFEQSMAYVPSSSFTPQPLVDTLPEIGVEQLPSPSLIIVPASLVYNWLNEARKFTPHLNVLNYTGVNREKLLARMKQYDLVVSTYGTIRSDIEELSKLSFSYVVLDESQNIKNPASQAAYAVRQLQCQYRLILTGTPVENSLNDLWSQLSFANPGLLGNYSYFQQKFVTPIEQHKDEEQARKLKTLISPFILRRTKSQVAQDLPDKLEQVVFCAMSPEQEKEYEQIRNHYRNEILKSIQQQGLSKSKFSILQGLTRLRQAANHPVLVNPDYLGGSGKYAEVLEKISTALQEEHKILVFSQFVSFLSQFRQHFDHLKIPYCYIDGSTPKIQRQAQVDLFQQNENIRLFLISLKAGGTGLNLTAADYVFIVDPWWNPQAERQAEDRTHRIGQQKKVFIYKFISQNTLEEKILHLQQKKSALADLIITTEQSYLKDIQVEEIMELLG